MGQRQQAATCCSQRPSFSFYASKLLEIWENQGKIDRSARQILRTVVIRISRDIFDHHRELGDIEQNAPGQIVPLKISSCMIWIWLVFKIF